ncbi:GyrI-like domain-containing protein [Nocardioides sp.]|uniref:GyrI-like domain-containing protein n=1 Tax=Nocardioides sp. TaxID=35761 RepID=UPI001A18E1DD|nr:GyrI-like domain-containing protein [Nocardioides sp.]MBJ7357001.1 GyrI-like domain-containing protein [Nocardioides sp.]
MTHDVEIVTVPARTRAVTRIHVPAEAMPTIGERMSEAFATVVTRLGRAGIPPTGPAFACYTPADGGFDVAAGFGVPDTFAAPPGLERIDLGAREVAHTTHLGSYSGLPSAYEDLQTEVTRRGRALDGDSPMWEEYWSGPETPDEKTRTEVYWPVAAV